MNNVPVPMDTAADRARTLSWRSRGRGQLNNFGRVANAGQNNQQRQVPNRNSPCYKCGETGHWARDCLVRSHAADMEDLIDFYELEHPPGEHPGSVDGRPLMSIHEIKELINNMGPKEKGKLADEMGVGEDFPQV
jgi:hypothetical protein